MAALTALDQLSPEQIDKMDGAELWWYALLEMGCCVLEAHAIHDPDKIMLHYIVPDAELYSTNDSCIVHDRNGFRFVGISQRQLFDLAVKYLKEKGFCIETKEYRDSATFEINSGGMFAIEEATDLRTACARCIINYRL